MTKFKIRKGDNVRVIAGAQKGSEGRVVKLILGSGRAIVEGVNLVKKHTKPALRVLKEVSLKRKPQLTYQICQY